MFHCALEDSPIDFFDGAGTQSVLTPFRRNLLRTYDSEYRVDKTIASVPFEWICLTRRIGFRENRKPRLVAPQNRVFAAEGD